MAENIVQYSPTEGELTRGQMRLLSQRTTGAIGSAEFYRRMRALGIRNPYRLLGEYQRGKILWEIPITPVPPPVPPQQRIWEYTRYYKYESKEKPSDNRNFEVRVYLPFPASYEEEDVDKHEAAAQDVCDRAMGLAFATPEVSKEGRRDPNTWEMLDASIPFEVTSRGFESGGVEKMSETASVTVEAKVTDKLGKYWRKDEPVTVYVRDYWEIPDWEAP